MSNATQLFNIKLLITSKRNGYIIHKGLFKVTSKKALRGHLARLERISGPLDHTFHKGAN